MKTYKHVLEEGRKVLIDNGIKDGEIDGWYLFSFVFKIERAKYFLDYEKLVTPEQYEKYIDLIARRSRHEPLQHILGYTEFMGLEFKVNKHVLIPRQDTETLVEEVLKVSDNKDVLDLCTGSGCIIISLKKLANINNAVGADISKDALKIARHNRSINNVDVTFIESDLFSNIEGKFDIIVSNPPYISSEDIEDLSVEVRDYEPLIALDGKEGGLYYYKAIVKEVRNYLKPRGLLFFEIGYNQADYMVNILEQERIIETEVIKDLAGHNRVVKAKV